MLYIDEIAQIRMLNESICLYCPNLDLSAFQKNFGILALKICSLDLSIRKCNFILKFLTPVTLAISDLQVS